MNIMTMKYPQYNFYKLIELYSEYSKEEKISQSLAKANSWYKVTEEAYKQFIHNWAGEPLDCVESHDYYSYMGKHYYVYTSDSRRVLARIENNTPRCEYYLALNV